MCTGGVGTLHIQLTHTAPGSIARPCQAPVTCEEATLCVLLADADGQALCEPGPAACGRPDAGRCGDGAGRARGGVPLCARLCCLAARRARLPRPRRLVPHARQPGALGILKGLREFERVL